MRFFITSSLFLLLLCGMILPQPLAAQGGTHVGLQVTPLAIGTMDLQAEQRLTNTVSLVFNTGFRTQQIDRREPRVRLLSDFSNQSNSAAFMGIGVRLFNPETGVDYPYVQFNLTGLWYKDSYLDRPSGHPKVSQGIAWGPSATIGYLINIDLHWQIDLGLQMGYSVPRQDLLAYYYPGLGYSTFGLGKYGVVGGHVQPVVTVKYKIRLDRRERLYETD